MITGMDNIDNKNVGYTNEEIDRLYDECGQEHTYCYYKDMARDPYDPGGVTPEVRRYCEEQMERIADQQATPIEIDDAMYLASPRGYLVPAGENFSAYFACGVSE